LYKCLTDVAIFSTDIRLLAGRRNEQEVCNTEGNLHARSRYREHPDLKCHRQIGFVFPLRWKAGLHVEVVLIRISEQDASSEHLHCCAGQDGEEDQNKGQLTTQKCEEKTRESKEENKENDKMNNGKMNEEGLSSSKEENKKHSGDTRSS